MEPEKLIQRYQDLQTYVSWSDDDARRVRELFPLIEPHFAALIDDFYEEIRRHRHAYKVITGGEAQIERLKNSLYVWLTQFFAGNYDSEYVQNRWRVGLRHVEVGLDQVYSNISLSRLRIGINRAVRDNWNGPESAMWESLESLNKLLDLDLALIEDAYETEHMHQLKHAEWRRSEATFRNLVETAECMIAILRNDAQIAYFSPFAETLTGYTAEEVVGSDYCQLFHSDDHRETLESVIEKALEGEPAQGFQNDIVCRDGRTHTLLWNARRLEHYENEPVVLLVEQDITSLKEAQAQALRSERLAVIGQMVTGLAHESRNALQRIQASVEMLELELEENPDALELVGRIQKSQDHVHRLFEEVRNYAAPIKLDRTPCQLPGLWREAWDLLTAHRQGRQAQLLEQVSDVDLQFSVDRFRLVQVFRNLLENSLAACDDPVEIVIDCVSARLHGTDAVIVTVRDNGPGLSIEQRERIFQPFFTTKTKGTGLGMSIAQRIVEAHGGLIEVGECSPPGTAIQITLPRSPK